MNRKNNEITDKLIELEKGALDRWGRGDPSGCLEISAPDITYFDPFIERRINGLSELTRYYESLRGKIRVDRYDLIDPKVELVGNVAILTFNYVSCGGTETSRWNCTEVYRLFGKDWKIIQTHWSISQPRLAKA